MGLPVSHIVPTYRRPRVAKRLVRSIRHFYPDAEICVCDDSPTPTYFEEAKNVPSPAEDIGLSAKRNLLVSQVETPYVFVWDDDYVCTEDTDIEGALSLLRSLEGFGIVGGEWRLEGGSRSVWFTGRIVPDGATLRLRPPQGRPKKVKPNGRVLEFHPVDLLPNFFIARTDLLRAVPWDEELKLNEHLEYFARLLALRGRLAEHDPKREAPDRALRWSKRWRKLAAGKPLKSAESGFTAIQALGTFRNREKLSHLEGNMIRRGEWAKVPSSYAEELIESGKAVSLSQEAETRPLPLPSPEEDPSIEDLPVHCALMPSLTCHHLRGSSRRKDYNAGRFRRDTFMPLQKAKLGLSERDLVQWSKYPYEEPDFSEPNPDLLELPKL